MGTTLIAIIGGITLVNSIAIIIINRRIKNVTKYFIDKIHELTVNNQLTDIISNDTNEHEDINKLATDLLKKIKRIYRLKSETYSDVINELRNSRSIEKDLQTALIDFFNEIIIISYKDEEMNSNHKEILKSKLRFIFKKLNNDIYWFEFTY